MRFWLMVLGATVVLCGPLMWVDGLRGVELLAAVAWVTLCCGGFGKVMGRA